MASGSQLALDCTEKNAMGRARKPAHIRRWRSQYYLVFTDYGVEPPKERRLSCTNLGAHDKTARDRLIQHYRSEEVNIHAESNKRGGALGYDTILREDLDEYLEDVKRRVAVRKTNPDVRAGLAEKSGKLIGESLTFFYDWLELYRYEHIETGQLAPLHLRRYREWLTTTETRRGNKRVFRSAATVNSHIIALRTAINWINDLRPPRFPDIEALRRALKPLPVRRREKISLTPHVLTRFLEQALDHEDPDKPLMIRRERYGRIEEFKQKKAVMPATPVSRLFVLLCLTGARVGEVLSLKWDDVDFEKGHITIYGKKTGYHRIVPLVDAPEGEISPTLLELLRRWKLQAGDRDFVLPYDNEKTDSPVFPKSAWERVNRNAGLPRIGPQMLRRCFTSFCASTGVPATVAALWQGHGANVAEACYREQVLERLDGNIEQAMGLAPLLEMMKGDGSLRVVGQ